MRAHQSPAARPATIRATVRALTWLGFLALITAAFAGPGALSAAAQNGNNGTVKIHEGSSHADPPRTDRNNQPHVCTFHVHGFGFDTDDTGTWRIYTWAPTGDGDLVANGSWSGAEWQSRLLQLPDGHYRLVTNIVGDANEPKDHDYTADKHKVFWVDCPDTAAPTSPAPASSSPSASASTRPSSAPPTGGVQPTQGAPSPTGNGQPASGKPSPSQGGEELPGAGTPPASTDDGDVLGTEGQGPTLPPTDAEAVQPGRTAGLGWGAILVILAMIGGTALALMPRSAEGRTTRHR